MTCGDGPDRREYRLLKGKWEEKDVEDFKDELIEKNTKAFLEDGMY